MDWERTVQAGDIPMQDPIAFFITWSAYGTWLPGDSRGWVEYRHGWKLPDPIMELECMARMTEDACKLTLFERGIVEDQIAETCCYRHWTLLAINCRSNHLHCVLHASGTKHKKIRMDLKAWCTRRLKEKSNPTRENWWAERGSIRCVWDEDSLERVILYVNDAQDNKHLDS